MMKKWFLMLLFGFIIFLPTMANSSMPELEYSFERRDSNSLKIFIRFSGNADGKTILRLPNEWAGQENLYKAISDMHIISANTVIEATTIPYEYIINYTPKASVVLSYVLNQDWEGPLVYPQYFRPVIDQDFFYFEGYSGLIYPVISDSSKIAVKIRYNKWKGDFTGTSFFANKKSKAFIISLKDLLNGIYCGGSMRSTRIKYGKQEIIIALKGDFLFSDQDVFGTIARVIKSERVFWNDFNQPFFFTLLLPMEDKGNSGGTAHYNSFSLFQSTNLKLGEGLLYLISHEYFHNWIGQGLKMPEPEELYKWFSEGFTDYYAYKILYSSHLLTDSDYISKLNKIIQTYYLSDYFKSDNKELKGNYWENPALKQLSYQRGLLIALTLDIVIRENNRGSLDDFLKSFYQQSKPDLLFSDSLFNQLCLKYAGADMVRAIDKINKGENEELTGIFANSRFYNTNFLSVNKQFELGFDFEQSKQNKKITGLKRGSNAEKAGLFDGMDITNRFSIWNNNTDKPTKIQIFKNGNTEWVEYLPVKEVNIQIPQIVSLSAK